MQLQARLAVRVVEMTDAAQVSLYWGLLREWAREYEPVSKETGEEAIELQLEMCDIKA